MIAWAVRRKYKGVEKLTVYPRYSRKAVRVLALRHRETDTNPEARHTVHKVSVDFLRTCGCGLVDDVGVLCRRHSPKIVVNAPPVCQKCYRCHRGKCQRSSDR